MDRLRNIAGMVIAAAEDDLRRRVGSDVEIVRGQVPLSYFARARLTDEMRSRCVGVVSQAHNANAPQNSIQLYRDGVLRWRRC